MTSIVVMLDFMKAFYIIFNLYYGGQENNMFEYNYSVPGILLMALPVGLS